LESELSESMAEPDTVYWEDCGLEPETGDWQRLRKSDAGASVPTGGRDRAWWLTRSRRAAPPEGGA